MHLYKITKKNNSTNKSNQKHLRSLQFIGACVYCEITNIKGAFLY